ncbi:TIGR00730 family Rossman fold protein [Patescibacteria group bacterium]|nr:TIGR00730 family Rossman fold protein [Patescibacteria group bacterium]
MSKKIILNIPDKHLPIKPLTKQELHDTAVDRVSLIAKEFTNGFNFLRDYPKSVTIFGGSRVNESDPNYIKARSLTSRIARELKYSVFTGGGPGIMEAANRGAFEAGGKSLGLTIELSKHQVQNQYLTNHLNFYYFFSRKVCMSFSAEAYIFFPGGFGTLDEFFEIVTLVQTSKIEKVPIILVGSEFWNSLDEFMKKEMLNRGTIDNYDLSLYRISDDEDEIIEIIKSAPFRNGIKFNHLKI